MRTCRLESLIGSDKQDTTRSMSMRWGLTTADDDAILNRASGVGAVVVTADADFGTLLALGGHARPSVVLLRSSDHLTPDEQADLVLNTLEHVSDALEHGAVATVTPGRVRLRSLPVEEP